MYAAVLQPPGITHATCSILRSLGSTIVNLGERPEPKLELPVAATLRQTLRCTIDGRVDNENLDSLQSVNCASDILPPLEEIPTVVVRHKLLALTFSSVSLSFKYTNGKDQLWAYSPAKRLM